MQQRRLIQNELDAVEAKHKRWVEAFESGQMPSELGTERIVELAARRDELRQTLAKVVPLQPPPPYLYKDETIRRFQAQLREVFLGGENALTKNYLKFLVEQIVITDDHVKLVARTDAALRMMATGQGGEPAGDDPACSPTFDLRWLRRRVSNPRPGG